MPNAVDLSDHIQGMTSHAAMMSRRAKVNAKLSAYDPDPLSLDACKKSENWDAPKQGNSWRQAIMNEIDNLKKFDVFKVVSLSSVPSGTKIFSIVTGYLTKRTKASTPEKEDVEKRKCRMCLGGHRAIEGVHYNKLDAYAPVPTWTTIKLQLALTSRHRLQLKAFDCVAAYLQAELKEPLYVYPPKGLMQELGQDPSKIWKLYRALYGWPPSGRIWYDKVSTWLHNYGFRTLGNSGTFMMLDRRNVPGDAGGIILLNLYSDDGLGSTDNSKLWDSFMADFKADFQVLEKDPDYFLGCAIEWDPITSVIKLDPGKYLREIVAKYDMTDIHSSPIPMPAGKKVYMNEEWSNDENLRNLYQQIAGSLNYASQLRPELMFSVSQLSRVMSCPTQENLALARQVIKYIIGSLDLKITYRPDNPNDPMSETNNELMMFTDSDWATSVDTRCSHGCYILMFAGAAIAHRSKAHKSVMLSSAAAEYYEASEGCRELVYVRGILKDFYGVDCPPTPTYIDNQACIAMAKMPVFSEKQKHIPIRVCHLRECCSNKIVELRPIGTKFEVADIGTKALPEPAFVMLRDVLLGITTFGALQGLQ